MLEVTSLRNTDIYPWPLDDGFHPMHTQRLEQWIIVVTRALSHSARFFLIGSVILIDGMPHIYINLVLMGQEWISIRICEDLVQINLPSILLLPLACFHVHIFPFILSRSLTSPILHIRWTLVPLFSCKNWISPQVPLWAPRRGCPSQLLCSILDPVTAAPGWQADL